MQVALEIAGLTAIKRTECCKRNTETYILQREVVQVLDKGQN